MSNKIRRQPLTANQFRRVLGRVVNSVVQSRLRMMGELDGYSGLDPIGRNLDAECGYPQDPGVSTFRRMYDRNDYANRVVNIWPDECWASRPMLYETEDKRVTKFERAWRNLLKKIDVLHYMHRLDRLAGIGSYGVMLLGLSDGKKLSTPAPGFDLYRRLKARPQRRVELVYLQTFAEDDVTIDSVDDREGSPRRGKPLYYVLNVNNPTAVDQAAVKQIRVHWSRVIHFADNCENNDTFGVPRQKPVLNRLLDLRKILGSSGEMFWKGGFPGFLATTQKDVDGSVADLESIREQVNDYLSGTQRVMGFDGMDVDPVVAQAIDPTPHVLCQVSAICAAGGYPVPVFLGRESGQLAGMENTAQWNKRVASRQELTVEPRVIRPVVNRFMDVGVLPEPPDREYFVSFKDLNTLGDKDKADVNLKQTQALMQYVTGKVESVVPLHQFLTMFLGRTEAEAQSIVDAVAANRGKELTDPKEKEKAAMDAEMQIKVAKAMPKPAATGKGSGSGQKRIARPQGGGRRGVTRGGRPRGVVARS